MKWLKKDRILKLLKSDWMPSRYIAKEIGMNERDCQDLLASLHRDGKVERNVFLRVTMFAKKGTSHREIKMARMYRYLGDKGLHSLKAAMKSLNMTSHEVAMLVKVMPEVEREQDKNGQTAYRLMYNPPSPKFVEMFPEYFNVDVKPSEPEKTLLEKFLSRKDTFVGFHVAFCRMAERMRVTMGGFKEPCEFAR